MKAEGSEAQLCLEVFLTVGRVPVKCLFEIKVRCIKTIDVLSPSELSSYLEFQCVVSAAGHGSL